MDCCSELLRLSVECIGYAYGHFDIFQHFPALVSRFERRYFLPRTHIGNVATTTRLAFAFTVDDDLNRICCRPSSQTALAEKKSHRFAQVSAPPFSDPPFSSRSGCCSADPLAIACDVPLSCSFVSVSAASAVVCHPLSSPCACNRLCPSPHITGLPPVVARARAHLLSSALASTPSSSLAGSVVVRAPHLLASPPDRHLSYVLGMSVFVFFFLVAGFNDHNYLSFQSQRVSICCHRPSPPTPSTRHRSLADSIVVGERPARAPICSR